MKINKYNVEVENFHPLYGQEKWAFQCKQKNRPKGAVNIICV